MKDLLTLFIILNVLNVILQTFKSIATIKCGPLAAALINAVSYSIYTIVLVYMNCDLSLWAKVVIVGSANFIGVYVVKTIERKMRKAKLWKVEATIRNEFCDRITDAFSAVGVPFSGLRCSDGKHSIINVYCSTHEQSVTVKGVLNEFKAKYFVSETKSL